MQALPSVSPIPNGSNGSNVALADSTSVEGGYAAAVAEGEIASPVSFDKVLAAQFEAIALGEHVGLDQKLEGDPALDVDSKSVLEKLATDIIAPSQFLAQNAPTQALQSALSQVAQFAQEKGLGRNEKLPSHERAAVEALGAADDTNMSALALSLRTTTDGDQFASELADKGATQIGSVEAASSTNTSHGVAEAHKNNGNARTLEAQPFNPRQIPEPVKSPAWGEALGQRVMWMAKENIQVVHLQVEPPNLGPLEIQLRLTNDQANVVFLSAHASVRDAISDSLSKLDELLSAGGVSLGSVSVNTQSQSPQQGSDAEPKGSPFGAWPQDGADHAAMVPIRTRIAIGLVDTFA